MIKNKEIELSAIFDNVLGMCQHTNLDDDNYCEDCTRHVPYEELDKISLLETAFDSPKSDGIGGGPLLQSLLTLITHFSKLHFKMGFGHDLCMELPNEKSASSFYYSGSKKSFAYNICWLAEILYRVKKSQNLKDKELRRIMNV